MINASETTTLRNLVYDYTANAAVFADRGNGSSYGEDGLCIRIDDDVLAKYGNTPMYRLDSPHVSSDGFECHWASDWFDAGQIEQRIFF